MQNRCDILLRASVKHVPRQFQSPHQHDYAENHYCAAQQLQTHFLRIFKSDRHLVGLAVLANRLVIHWAQLNQQLPDFPVADLETEVVDEQLEDNLTSEKVCFMAFQRFLVVAS